MTERSFPFDTGAGANVAEEEWAKMGKLWAPTGIRKNELNGLSAYGDSSGMHVKLRTGKAWVEGFYYENDAEKILPIAANSSGVQRYDRVVIRLDRANNQVISAIVQGTPGGGIPALTKTSVIYEIPVATVSVGNGVGVISSTVVQDQRQKSSSPVGLLAYSKTTRDFTGSMVYLQSRLIPSTMATIYTPGGRLIEFSATARFASDQADDDVYLQVRYNTIIVAAGACPLGPPNIWRSAFAYSVESFVEGTYDFWLYVFKSSPPTANIREYGDSGNEIILTVKDIGPV